MKNDVKASLSTEYNQVPFKESVFTRRPCFQCVKKAKACFPDWTSQIAYAVICAHLSTLTVSLANGASNGSYSDVMTLPISNCLLFRKRDLFHHFECCTFSYS